MRLKQYGYKWNRRTARALSSASVLSRTPDKAAFLFSKGLRPPLFNIQVNMINNHASHQSYQETGDDVGGVVYAYV